MKSDKQFSSVLSNNIRQRGNMDKLVSNCTKTEIINKVKENFTFYSSMTSRVNLKSIFTVLLSTYDKLSSTALKLFFV